MRGGRAFLRGRASRPFSLPPPPGRYVADLPNGAAIVVNGQTYKAIGHNNPNGGGSENAFGHDFKSDDGKYGWGRKLCCGDSDGDGFTNGHELGDPCCVWKKGAVPANTTGLSHPGIASSTPANVKPGCVATVCKAFLAEAATPALRGGAASA